MTPSTNSDRIEKLRKLHETDPGDADVCYMIAQELGKQEEHETAIGWYDKCIDADLGYCYAYFFKAVELNKLGRREEAVETVRTAIPIAEQSGHPKAHDELRQLLLQMEG